MLMAGELTTQFAHENAALSQERERRQAMPNRVIQTGGVITIADAIRMKRSRENGEDEKEKRAEMRRQKKRDKLIAEDNTRLLAAGQEPSPDGDPNFNPDYMDWDSAKKTDRYREWHDRYQQLCQEDSATRLTSAGDYPTDNDEGDDAVNSEAEEDEIGGFSDYGSF
ncbi:hypothetical protein QFC19_006750 [Naganishia cerealis]|uniref:Uncharacterized protein n=1 Tax=Naganishia cerealis TaxID=610337 RepID=A0ACC2VDK6_9TREE|nr:hypothetical protein QFC19_006750 [Naganishia cerealis]